MTDSTRLLQGEIALVTGASRGIGRAIAQELARQGAIVIGTATSEAGAASITAYLQASNGKATDGQPDAKPMGSRGVVLDVNDAVAAVALIDAIQKAQGGLSILVNNAGITQDQLAMRMKEEEWDAVIATNLTAVARLSRAVLRGMMKAKRGRIINITSVVGSAGNAGQMNYAAAKAGVAGMSRALAREIGSRNITVNCIAPGFIDTDMTKALNPQQIAAMLQQIPLGRFGLPEDIAAAVCFLASPQAGYITGSTLHVNGGMYM
ncbi:MAG: 3-oxoacyl-ACP reductase FabG, partial [Herminiimonas sp.]|nr:3-oxoacyl-ACP reductase FabG [Herminiimonas sp.]